MWSVVCKGRGIPSHTHTHICMHTYAPHISYHIISYIYNYTHTICTCFLLNLCRSHDLILNPPRWHSSDPSWIGKASMQLGTTWHRRIGSCRTFHQFNFFVPELSGTFAAIAPFWRRPFFSCRPSAFCSRPRSQRHRFLVFKNLRWASWTVWPVLALVFTMRLVLLQMIAVCIR